MWKCQLAAKQAHHPKQVQEPRLPQQRLQEQQLQHQ
jgi:hypothetical protein